MRSDGFAEKSLASSLLSSPKTNTIFFYQPGLVVLALLLMAIFAATSGTMSIIQVCFLIECFKLLILLILNDSKI